MLTKVAEGLYAHTTSLENLDRILSGDAHLKSLAALAKDNPDAQVSTEPSMFPFLRYTAPAKDAYKTLLHMKSPGRLFFTRNGYLPNYGDAVIVKKLNDSIMKPHDALNSIPEEYTTGRRISLRRKADIYLPDSEREAFAERYPGLHFRSSSENPLKPFSLADRAKALYNKLVPDFMKTGGDSAWKKMFGSPARQVGSSALGIAVPGQSDIDVFVPYKTERGFSNAIQRLQQNYPDMHMNEASMKKPDKRTFTGKVNGQPMDVVLAYGPRAQRFDAAFTRAQNMLKPEDKAGIIAQKEKLKNSWFFPDTRYKVYKKELAGKLGLRGAYF